MKFFHIDPLGSSVKERLERLESIGVTKYIVLQRRNYLKKVISSVKAAETTRWHQPANIAAVSNKIHLDPQDVRIDGKTSPLANLLSSYHDSFEELREYLAGRQHLWLTYEDDVEISPTQSYSRVEQFLELEHHQPVVRYGRTNPYSPQESIANFEDIENVLKHSKFEWMLEG